MFSKLFSLLIIFYGLGFSLTAGANAESTVIMSLSADGSVVSVDYASSWENPGSIQNNYLDFAHTSKTYNDIVLEPGYYRWELETQKRNNKPGKVNLDIHVKYQDNSKTKRVDKKLSPGRTDSGYFTIDDYKSKSSGSPAGYGKIKVHIGRAAYNTNVYYKVRITKSGGNSGSNNGSNNGNGNYGNNSSNSGAGNGNCTYTTLGSKSGNVIGNTVGKYTSTKKACKNTAKVRISKTGGNARTTILVYKSSSRNGTGSLVKSIEFAKNSSNSTKYVNVPNANGKFIRVEVKNRSAAKTFKYKLMITQ